MALENVTLEQAAIADLTNVFPQPNMNTTYGGFVRNLVKEMGSYQNNLMHAAVGISGEAGELLDAVKKHWAYGKPIDRVNVIEELGDLEFYMAAMRMLVGTSRTEVLNANVVKLSKRYNSGSYSDEQAQQRADKVEETTGLSDFNSTLGTTNCTVCDNDITKCAEILSCPANSIAVHHKQASLWEVKVLSQQQVAGMDDTMGFVQPTSPAHESKLKEQRMDAAGELPPIYY